MWAPVSLEDSHWPIEVRLIVPHAMIHLSVHCDTGPHTSRSIIRVVGLYPRESFLIRMYDPRSSVLACHENPTGPRISNTTLHVSSPHPENKVTLRCRDHRVGLALEQVGGEPSDM